MSAVDLDGYVPVCHLDAIAPETGVSALVRGVAVAVFRTHDDEIHVVSNHDPLSDASVLSRGIVGSRGGVPVVSSPMYKHAFDLRTGQCLDDETARVEVYETRLIAETVHVGPCRSAESTT